MIATVRCLFWLNAKLTVLVIVAVGTANAGEGDAASQQTGSAKTAEHQDPPALISEFLQSHCWDCHGDDAPEAGLSLTTLSFDLSADHVFGTWRGVYERVQAGEMPPESELGPKETDVFLGGLNRRLMETDSHDVATRGRVRGRRLTRTEYEHTVQSLLGIDLPLRNLLSEDATVHGFETVAAGQQLSHHLLARYLDVADRALAEAFNRALDGDVSYVADFTPDQMSENYRENFRCPESRNGKSISWPIRTVFYGRMPATRIPADGWYRITLRNVHAVNPAVAGTVWGTLRSGACYADAPILYMIGLVEATMTPRDLVYDAWIRGGHMLELKPNDRTLLAAPTGTPRGGQISYANRILEEQGFSGIANRGIRIERIYLKADRETVIGNLLGDAQRDQWESDPEGVLERLVIRFASRAFRRPVTLGEVAAYRQIGLDVLSEGDSFVEALRVAYRAILCSPRTLTFVEQPGPLDDYAIASRLSYALWTDMPDETLMRLAGEGELRREDVLEAQIDRMLDDPRSEQFINSFTDQWLKLNQIDFTTPDPKQFRTFDPVVQESMLQESRVYVRELIDRDLGVAHFVDSDFASLNERLIRHYGITDEVKDWKPGDGVQQVSLASRSIRGGLITQGAILKVTADGTTTSPVIRGVFVNERILGEQIPPPPPGLPAVEPDVRGTNSIRDQLAKHRSDESCNACHRIIDPPGFALESFDPVGVWRDHYGIGGKGAAVNPAGTTAGGDSFDGLLGWKQLYVNQPERLARGFAEQLLTYATGAPIRYSDEPVIDRVVAESEASGYGLRTLIRAALTSDIFLNK